MDDTPATPSGEGVTRRTARHAARRRRTWIWVLVAVVVVGAAAGAFLLIQESQTVALGAISPASGALLNGQPVTVSCELVGYVPGRGSLSLLLDGRPVPAAELDLHPGSVLAKLPVPDGEHTVALAYDSSNVFSRHLARSWSFSVDTVAPQVAVATPASFPLLLARSSDLTVGLSEPAVVALTLDGAPLAADPSGQAAESVSATIVADEGKHVLGVSAADHAGNVTKTQWDLTVDYRAPEFTAEGLPTDEVWKKANAAAVTLRVADRFPEGLQVTAALDGTALALAEGKASGDGARAFSFETGTLPEGTHEVLLSAADQAGHVTEIKREFLIDTSSTFGARTMKTGAVGGDVEQLQRILKIKGVYEGQVDGDYGESTAAAVAAFNAQKGLKDGQVVSKATLKYLLGSLRIDLSERKLYLYGGDGEVIKSYRVAVGMPQYPTPTGSFRIISKEVDPTWDPPNSAWARGMGPVPPGPNNPLGTRWMGLSSPGIGIHGTPSPSSIGTAASHGCIRMRIPEAEDLFGRVFVGTPVEIVK